MKRSVRNGLAVVGMAGGMWLLGHAVANAAENTTQVAGAGNSISQTTQTGGTSSNDGTDLATGTNDHSTDTATGNTTGGGGGVNGLGANTGQDSTGSGLLPANQNTAPATTLNYGGDPSKPVTTVTIVTGHVTADQQADGGDDSDSGNIDGTDGPVMQAATASNEVNQAATDNGASNKRQHGDSHDGTTQDSSSSNYDSHGSNGDNDSKNVASSENDDSTTITGGNVSGGDGGSNSVDINTGLIGNTFVCPEHSSCVYNITTGNVTVYQEANGGNVTNSGNVTIGRNNECGCKPKASPAPPPTPAPVVKTVAKKTAVLSGALSGAQPTGTLATTGADYSAPLTVGLLALGAGSALTLAGRRRREAQAA